jgi:hypothetical protein
VAGLAERVRVGQDRRLGTKKLEFETFRAETVIMASDPLVITRSGTI